jgi:hypothetical protein
LEPVFVITVSALFADAVAGVIEVSLGTGLLAPAAAEVRATKLSENKATQMARKEAGFLENMI